MGRGIHGYFGIDNPSELRVGCRIIFESFQFKETYPKNMNAFKSQVSFPSEAEMKALSTRFRMPLLVLGICLALVTVASAQYTSGIDATIVDPSGGGIANAQMTVINQDTQVKQTGSSDNRGYVQILHLPPGNYSTEIRAAGFNAWVQSGIAVAGNEIHTIYPKMSVGRLETTVQVQAETQTVETNRSAVGRSLEEQTIRNAPLVGENLYASVATLAPGITGSGLEGGGGAASGAQGTNSYSAEPAFQINVAGQRQEANEYRVDGTNVNDSARDGVVTITPVPDTVAEMKLTTVTFSADKGRYSGGLYQAWYEPISRQPRGNAHRQCPVCSHRVPKRSSEVYSQRFRWHLRWPHHQR